MKIIELLAILGLMVWFGQSNFSEKRFLSSNILKFCDWNTRKKKVLDLRGGGWFDSNDDEFPEDFDYGIDGTIYPEKPKDIEQTNKSKIDFPEKTKAISGSSLALDNSNGSVPFVRPIMTWLFGVLVGNIIAAFKNKSESLENGNRSSKSSPKYMIDEIEELKLYRINTEGALQKAREAEKLFEKTLNEAKLKAMTDGRLEGMEAAKKDVDSIYSKLEEAESELKYFRDNMEQEIMNAEVQALRKFEMDTVMKEERVMGLEKEILALQDELKSLQNELERLRLEGYELEAARKRENERLRIETEIRIEEEKQKHLAFAQKQVREIKDQIRTKLEQAGGKEKVAEGPKTLPSNLHNN
eukprot:CAMPEP_0171455586 /NCGR_PEP_ID=MMETSP0945-20130129/2421_1 /TAXON_ID=109269 /ORGANISM="Vaucheria litorea, Strain CCMP2940" /LENGTH=355 /DNA_ID=CAMNT_0011980855 /DNA_START=23 /DNA_END=1088 /DNA_ORIENTATION=+